MYIHKLFQGKEAVQIVPIPSCSAVISLEVLFCEWTVTYCLYFSRDLLQYICSKKAVEVGF